MRKTLSRCGGNLCIWITFFFLPMLLASCFTANQKQLSDGNAQERGMIEECPQQKVAGHDYVYNRPHAVPADYVYRTERVFPPPPGNNGKSASGEKIGKQAATDQQAEKLLAAVHDLVDQLMHESSAYLEEDQRLTVSTFVNLNDLYKTSEFGRFLGEEMVNKWRASGLEIIDVRKTPNILVRERFGEFGMSRDMEELPFVHEAHATVVGTYSIAADQIFVNARVLRNSDGFVIASASEVLQKNTLLASMLEDESSAIEKNLQTVQIEAK